MKHTRTRELLRTGKYRVYEDIAETNDGEEVSYLVVSHPPSVVIIPQFDNGDFLLLRQYRHCIRSTIYEFPAGTVHEDEDLLLAAQRELAEEAGVGATEIISLGSSYAIPGYGTEVLHFYHATGLFQCRASKDADEEIVTERVSKLQLTDLIRRGSFQDTMSLAGLMLLGSVRS